MHFDRHLNDIKEIVHRVPESISFDINVQLNGKIVCIDRYFKCTFQPIGICLCVDNVHYVRES